MPVYRLGRDPVFPPPGGATVDGIVAIGGDVTPRRLRAAYQAGIFPWPVEGYPLLWFSPDPRSALVPADLRVSRSLRKRLRREPFRVTSDLAFEAVMRACAETPRAGQRGTWITDELIEGYIGLHREGIAHSVEAWHGDTLVGGLYGVSLGAAFFGESMFTRVPDASKVAFVRLVTQLDAWGFHFIDCQVQTAHLDRFGATAWPRARFLAALDRALACPTRAGPWTLEPSVAEVLAAGDAPSACPPRGAARPSDPASDAPGRSSAAE
ncbi:MAG: leucyl/phenylalanyl-tRNA--protein transferase [Myxococcales bacterium]|nr:leucyl/phenylalanyl-tRNA--protein transferase [Myxococcales bacterium]